MRKWIWALYFTVNLSGFFCPALTISTFSPVKPPAIPLAVNSPYLNVLLADGGKEGGGYLARKWPNFWTGHTVGWAGMIRVDGIVYTWMGIPGPQPMTQTAFEYTSTKSIFTFNAEDKVELQATFLSPVTPDDLKRQSLTSTYLNVAIRSLDGAAHDVQLYTDISAEWISGDNNSVAQWNFGRTDDNISYHKVFRQTQLLFSEVADQAEWGSWYWATRDMVGLTHQSGADEVVRNTFINTGKLENSQDVNYRPIRQNYPVFGFSLDLGSVIESKNTLFTINLGQELAMQYATTSGKVQLPSLWRSYFPIYENAVSFFYNDFDYASSTATNIDNQIATDSITAGGQDYLTITSLSLRQAFGATQLVGDKSKQYLFMKEISSDGNTQTVDVIYPFYPIIMYLQPSLAKLLLDPLFETQESGLYPKKSSMHDLGSHFPNATGYPDGLDEPQPLEECGNMLIMTLAYSKRANDTSYLDQHYQILKQWTEYLVEFALIPDDQLSTDDFAGHLANQTNLALKGIIGIRAMAEISNLTGHDTDGLNYTSIAQDFISKWQTYGVAQESSPPRATLAYGLNDTYVLLYNLYADSLLNLNFVPKYIYDMQSAFYTTAKENYGIPLDSRHKFTKSDWQIWVASISNDDTKNTIISDLARYIRETPTDSGFTDLYDTTTADWAANITHFNSRPVVGGHFALLALKA
ncbi:putative glutaminase [Erysiphe necator]|uniref:Putative glutaminase n=1 Tax=Uncinula necator TaxID=52586 RepID=A0A0B1P5N7_UNCNE|nr:putative glutaminase [Erysiphe necator]